MRNIRQTNQATVTFSRWSGKSYAVFASLKKSVTISHLSVAMSNAYIQKDKVMLRLLTDAHASASHSLLDDEDTESIDSFSSLLQEIKMMMITLMAFVPSEQPVIHIISEKKPTLNRFDLVWAFFVSNFSNRSLN